MKIKNIAIGLDLLINTIFGGYPGETMSGRTWRLRNCQPYKTIRPVIDWLFSFWGPDHCQRSYESRSDYLPTDQK
jgi:hypothetical protein